MVKCVYIYALCVRVCMCVRCPLSGPEPPFLAAIVACDPAPVLFIRDAVLHEVRRPRLMAPAALEHAFTTGICLWHLCSCVMW